MSTPKYTQVSGDVCPPAGVKDLLSPSAAAHRNLVADLMKSETPLQLIHLLVRGPQCNVLEWRTIRSLASFLHKLIQYGVFLAAAQLCSTHYA